MVCAKLEVLVADDRPMIRSGLKALAAGSHDMVVCGEAADDDGTLAMIRQREWGLVMLDLCIPGRSGFELIKMIRAERPRLPILVFTAQREELHGDRAIRAGASGYLSHRAEPEVLLSAMRHVGHGRMFVRQQVSDAISNITFTRPGVRAPRGQGSCK